MAVLLAAPAASCAFWGSPGGGNWFQDFMGGGFCDFSLNTGGGARGREGRYGYHGYGPHPGGYAPPYGYYAAPYGALPHYGVPVAPLAPAAPVSD